MTDVSEAVQPPITPRNIRFAFEGSLPQDWHSGEPGITAFYDALSMTFPEGERFFVASVRNYAAQVTDPQHKSDVEAFTAQESIHSREHSAYNALMKKRGIPIEKFEAMLRTTIRFAQRHVSAATLLAATSAYEHYTALFAELLLGDPEVLAGAHPFYRDLWRWHAMEEEEHKAVAFDVYRTQVRDKRRYLRRAAAMVFVTMDFWITNTGLVIWLMARRGQLFNLRAWSRLWRHLWIEPGVWRHVMEGVSDYFRRDFHPWQRQVKPEVLAWRTYYRQTAKRVPAAASLFDPRVA